MISGRVELEDRLGVEVVAVLGDERQVVGALEVRGHVPPDQQVAQPELVDGAREGAVHVEGEDPAGVGDRDAGALRVGDRGRQVLLGVLGDRVELVWGTASFSPSHDRTSASGFTSASGGAAEAEPSGSSEP